MNNEEQNIKTEAEEPQIDPSTQSVENTDPQMSDEQPATEISRMAELEAQIQDLKDKNMRMMAEFDNYRRRTNKEKLDLIATAGERVLIEILPLIDDLERAEEAIRTTDDINAVREGIELIHRKIVGFLEQQNVHEIPTKDADFSVNEHEAVTLFSAGEDKKGKIIDCVQKGYKLGDKVIRFAKVVVGQ